MSARPRASSSITNKEQSRLDMWRIDRLKQRAFRSDTTINTTEGLQWVDSMKDKKPAPVVIGDRGNAAPLASESKYSRQRRQALRACMTFWKAVVRLRMRKLQAFAAWAHQTPTPSFIQSRVFLCYAPSEQYTPRDEYSSMEEVD